MFKISLIPSGRENNVRMTIFTHGSIHFAHIKILNLEWLFFLRETSSIPSLLDNFY